MLEYINSPDDVKALTLNQKRALAAEIRQTLIKVVSRTGGHLSSNLGAVDLTIALACAFNPPQDKIIFDVGHQTYAYKLITGRAKDIDTLRQKGGISGFPRTDESAYDAYDTGHASTAISAALGMARARDLRGETYRVAAVVGDGALTGGMCYEALNDAGQSHTKLIVVLNDNDMSISANVGAMSAYLTKMRQSGVYRAFKQKLRALLMRLPRLGAKLTRVLARLRDSIKSLFVSDLFFGALGFEYLGPIDGHDIEQMTRVIERAHTYNEPVLIHVVTRKGSGYAPAENSPDHYHGVLPFFIESGEARNKDVPSSGEIAAELLAEYAKEDSAIVAISAAMLNSTGLYRFKAAHPERCLDVGIAEQHAVTMAAGMALGGLKPYVAIYSTFLQRAYDQILSDVCLNGARVTFLIDRSGLVGADGATHQGVYDLCFLRQMPGMIIGAPKDEIELKRMISLSLNTQGPMAIRYPKRLPRGDMPCAQFALGEWTIEVPSEQNLIIATGKMVNIANEAQALLSNDGIQVGVINARFVKPMDDVALKYAARASGLIVTLEDNAVQGGFGEGVAARLEEYDFNGHMLIIGVPDRFIAHASVDEQALECGMDAISVANSIREKLSGSVG